MRPPLFTIDRDTKEVGVYGSFDEVREFIAGADGQTYDVYDADAQIVRVQCDLATKCIVLVPTDEQNAPVLQSALMKHLGKQRHALPATGASLHAIEQALMNHELSTRLRQSQEAERGSNVLQTIVAVIGAGFIVGAGVYRDYGPLLAAGGAIIVVFALLWYYGSLGGSSSAKSARN